MSYAVMTTIEEMLEMIGVTVFLNTLMYCVNQLPNCNIQVEIRFPSDSH